MLACSPTHYCCSMVSCINPCPYERPQTICLVMSWSILRKGYQFRHTHNVLFVSSDYPLEFQSHDHQMVMNSSNTFTSHGENNKFLLVQPCTYHVLLLCGTPTIPQFHPETTTVNYRTLRREAKANVRGLTSSLPTQISSSVLAHSTQPQIIMPTDLGAQQNRTLKLTTLLYFKRKL